MNVVLLFFTATNTPQVAEMVTAEDREVSVTLPIISVDQLIDVCQSQKVIEFKVFSSMIFYCSRTLVK